MERYFEKVSRLVASILGAKQASEVDDVVQDVFVRVHRGISNFRSDSKFSTWIFRIAYNQSITYRSRFARRFETVTGDTALAVLSREENPAESLDNDQLRLILDKAIDRLPPEYQTAVRLFYWFDVPVAEISEQLGSPVNTIKSWLHRARKLLANDLEKQGHLT